MTENQATTAVAAPVDPKITARWRVSLHEAGHAVAGRHLLRRTARAVVFDDPCGLADLGGEGAVPASFAEALATAAGPAAEVLAEHHAPPESPLAVPLEVTYAEEVKPLREKVSRCMPDHIAVARWCIGGIEKQPDRWAKRYNWVHREARILVARHRQEIVEPARRLFERGLVTLFAPA
jgi:hypothetical protein